MKIDLAGQPAIVVGPAGILRSAAAAALAGNGAKVAEAEMGGALAAVGRTPPCVLVHVTAGAGIGPVEPPPALPDLDAFAGLVRAVMPSAKRIVSIVSVAGVVPVRRAPVFSAAEAALVSLTRSLAMEAGGNGTAVNAIAVGALAGEGVTAGEALLTHAAVKRPARLDEVMAALLFLADPANTYTTGHVLNVDGGWSAGYARNF
ncbi:MAG: SDR family oxidoreductase [Rhizobiales bacterium]|nr:SDR family oxidoreductase [Hyphomicrobiales bacterium]